MFIKHYRPKIYALFLMSCRTIVWLFQKLKQREPLYLFLQGAYFISARIYTSKRHLRNMAKHEFNAAHMHSTSQNIYLYPPLDITRWHWADMDISHIAASVHKQRRVLTIIRAERIIDGKFEFRSTIGFETEAFNWTPSGMTKGWIWDLNRQNWFVTLAFAFRYTNDRRFIDKFIQYSEDWIRTFVKKGKLPPNDNPFEVAARVNAWLWAYFLLQDQSLWKQSSKQTFVSALRFLCVYLFNTIEYIAPGNHLLLEAKALVLAGECFGESRLGRRLRKRGWWYLNRELDKQICEDGVHAERSTMYHRIIAGELGELCAYYSKFQPSIFFRISEIVKKMAVFSASIENTDGSFALFGDAHLVDTYYRFNPTRLFRLIPEYTTQFDDIYDDHTDWLELAHGDQIASTGGSVVDKTNIHFSTGGYHVIRSGWHRQSDVLVWDCGQVGYKPNRKHAHADSLSFTLAVDGRPFLIDPGMDEFKSPLLSLRSTRSHNAIVVDSQDSSILAPRSEIWAPASCSLREVHCLGDITILAGSHDGYRRLKQPVTVFRVIVTCTDQYWLIVDLIFGVGAHAVDQYFHLAPELRAKLVGDRAYVVSQGHQNEYEMRFLGHILQPDSQGNQFQNKLSVENRDASQYSGRIDKYIALRNSYWGTMPVVLTAGISKKKAHVKIEQFLSMDTVVVSVNNSSIFHRITIRANELVRGIQAVDAIKVERLSK